MTWEIAQGSYLHSVKLINDNPDAIVKFEVDEEDGSCLIEYANISAVIRVDIAIKASENARWPLHTYRLTITNTATT